MFTFVSPSSLEGFALGRSRTAVRVALGRFFAVLSRFERRCKNPKMLHNYTKVCTFARKCWQFVGRCFLEMLANA